MNVLLQDVRYAVRQLRRQRGSSVVAALTLALGIGVSTALFSIVDAAMLRPLPYLRPEQLVAVSPEVALQDGRVSRATASMEDMRTWQQADDVFSVVAGWGNAFRGRILDAPEPQRLRVMHVTEDYLALHGINPIAGRSFEREDCDPGAPLVALLGHGYWQRQFGGRDVLHTTMRLDNELVTIVGVLPAGFNAAVDVSLPLRVPAKEYARRGTGRVSVYARLRDGVTIEEARARLSARMTATVQQGGTAREIRVSIHSLLESALARHRTTVNVFAGAVALIVLMAAVNVAGLLLARGAVRQAELVVRVSLGAGRARLIRQLLTEAAVLAIPGGAIGVLLAWLALDLIVAKMPLVLSPDSPVVLNVRVLFATGVMLLATAVLTGLVPAIRLSRVNAGAVLVGTRQVGSSLSRRGGQGLIAAEVALAVVLVTGGGLMLRSLLRIAAVDLGFRLDGLLTMQVLPIMTSPAAQKEYYIALLRQLRGVPGIASVGMVDNFALGETTTTTSLTSGSEGAIGSTVFDVMPGYFETIDATLRDGRVLTESDYHSGLRAVVISESASRAFFGGTSPIGRPLYRSGRGSEPWIVRGVIADLRHGGPLDVRQAGQPQVFFPLDPSQYDPTRAMTVVIRTSGCLPDLAGQVRRVAESIGPRVLIEQLRSADELFTQRVITPRRRAVLLGLLGALGLMLALVGVFGTTAYAVARRVPEIGVRLAMGARPAQVVLVVVRDSAVPVMIGALIGVAAAFWATRAMESFLFQSSPTDPMTLTVAPLLVIVAGLIAALVPALRASRVDPALSLRAE